VNIGAVWWRVSTADQLKISPDTQKQEALALAKLEGYDVPEDHILGTDWGSLSVWESPAMDRLKALIKEHSIRAVFMYDADRGPAKPAHRLFLRALCEENGVIIRCCHGQVPDGDMGEVMEFLSTWSKEKQVHRAQQRARDGKRDRAKIYRLPVQRTTPLGYQWVPDGTIDPKGNPTSRTLKSDDNFPIVQYIWGRALQGKPLRGICKELDFHEYKPRRGDRWAPTTIQGILDNPLYAGRYAALRYVKKDPKYRSPTAKKQYGKTSGARRDEQDWIWLDDIIVDPPVVTWAEFQAVQRRRADNKALAAGQRASKRNYLLRGLLICGECGHRYGAKPSGAGIYYRCRKYCSTPSLR
jgi:site-specific DNA recombinase